MTTIERENRMNEQEKLELKLQALKESFKEKIASMVDDYENRIADLRVELTVLHEAYQQVNAEISRRNQPAPEYVEGELVTEEE